MATFIQRNGAWFAQIRRKGHKSISRTFDTKAQAERWALQIEAGMGVGTYVDNRETLAVTLGQCLRRYASEITPDKKGGGREQYRVNLWLSDPLSKRSIGTIKSMDIAGWRDARIASGISGSTVQKDLAMLSHLFTIAIQEWGYALVNPVTNIRKPKSNKPRDRRLQADEEVRLLDACGLEMRAFVTLAIETAMRRGELVGLRRCWISGAVVRLPDTKNGSSRDVPLSSRALAALASLPARLDGKVFALQVDAYTRGFERACKACDIDNLVLHDLRHEATSRFFERGLDVMQVKAITGHKSLSMLSRYTHLRAADLARLLG